MVLQVICLLHCLSGCLGLECSWVEKKGWSGGAKALLKVNVEQALSSWNITFRFNKDVIFEAWKGDVTALSRFIHTLTS